MQETSFEAKVRSITSAQIKSLWNAQSRIQSEHRAKSTQVVVVAVLLLPSSLKMRTKGQSRHLQSKSRHFLPHAELLHKGHVHFPVSQLKPVCQSSLPNVSHEASIPIQLANVTAKSRSRSRQPSPESRATFDGRGRNYSAQNAKRKRLSSSPISSRKRSSAG